MLWHYIFVFEIRENRQLQIKTLSKHEYSKKHPVGYFNCQP